MMTKDKTATTEVFVHSKNSVGTVVVSIAEILLPYTAVTVLTDVTFPKSTRVAF